MNLDLSERRRRILKAVIQQYIETAIPVASQDLARQMGVSSATVRNEMSALEEAGLLTHLHTSAGRVPTDTGYRFFVENLMDRAPLSAQEQRTIKHQFYQVRSDFDQWIHLAAAVLSRTAHAAAVVTPPRAYESRFKHLELISINDMTVLMVLVLHEGTVKQQTLPAEPDTIQDQLSRSANRINSLCDNASVSAIRTLVQAAATTEPPLSGFERTVMEMIARSMQQFEDQMNELIHHDGLLEMLDQPEFMHVGRVREVLSILQGGAMLDTLIPQALASNGVQVIIGGEHGRDELRDYSVVLSRYGVDGEATGVLGVIGPRRMAYPRSISTVRYIATVMSDLLNDLYGTDTKAKEEL
jgi:heat-inducible transcriptional repressor